MNIDDIINKNFEKAASMSELAAKTCLDESQSWRFNKAVKLLIWLVGAEVGSENPYIHRKISVKVKAAFTE